MGMENITHEEAIKAVESLLLEMGFGTETSYDDSQGEWSMRIYVEEPEPSED